MGCAHIIYAPIGLDNKNSNERFIFITLLSKELLCLVQYQIGFGLVDNNRIFNKCLLFDRLVLGSDGAISYEFK